MSMSIVAQLAEARKRMGMTQAALAEAAGLSRMTVQRIESGDIDPRLSSLLEMGRVLGLEALAVPSVLRPELEAFVRAGGRLLGQPAGAGAPPSVVDAIGRQHDGTPG
ncbi:MAG: XRE family transcriptional regulator [Variovorax paradoxus]|nr:helix-turn-helix transcriptional regulator [Pseudorhodoferax sp. Leaf265]KQP17161.1 XRE family transcriptional regulator [Pseudorhodoferax sp. Leaf265]PZQ00703.1 MAG: XRE family transcriptional regulator [Variovorax paradoxus]PZQ13434.1 MAG: XRE family transcriptional regulator [Variovorax paradoxus]